MALSPDPAKAQRQLDALAAGRRALARKVLAETSTPAAAPPTPPAPASTPHPAGEHQGAGTELGGAAAGAGLSVPVHNYGPPPTPPPPTDPNQPLPIAEDPSHDRPARRPRRGFLAGFLDD